MDWQTLFVPHDYSPCADRALALAGELARHHKAKVILAHVTHVPPGLTADSLVMDRESGDMVRVDEYARNQAMRELDARARALRDSGIDVTIEVGIGDISEEIGALATRHHADVIVMGTHGRTGLAHLLLGSVAEKVLRHATIPVLTVRDRVDPRRTTSEIVVTDLATD